MGKIKKILENELVGGTQTTDVYPVTSTKAVYDENNERLDNILGGLRDKIGILKNAGYLYAGIATIDTNPGTPNAKVFYIANGKGTYTNFGGIEVTEDDVVVLYWDSSWHKVSTGIASNEKLTELEGELHPIQEIDGYDVATITSHAINADGSLTSNSNYRLLRIPNNNYKSLRGIASSYEGYLIVAFWNTDTPSVDSFISGTLTQISYTNQTFDVYVPSGTQLIGVTYTLHSPATPAEVTLVKHHNRIDELERQIAEIPTQIQNAVTTAVAPYEKTKNEVDAMLEATESKIYKPADFTEEGYYNRNNPTRTSGYDYTSLPIIHVVEGQKIYWHKWSTNPDISLTSAVCCYDNDGLPYNGVDARINYSDLTTKDYENGEFTFVIPSNCSQIGVSFNFPTNHVQNGATFVVGDAAIGLTQLAKDLINQAVKIDGDGGDRTAHFFLKGNSNIVYSSAKKLGIIAAGQSNIDGRNAYNQLPAGFINPNNKVKICKNSNGTFDNFEVVDGGAGNDWSFDAILYDALTNPSYGNQSEIYVVKKSMGGTSIDPNGATDYHWTAEYEGLPAGHSLLRDLESYIRAGVNTQGSNFDIKAFIWHQGEGDADNADVASRYYENLKNMIAYVRGVVGNPRLHFFCGNLSNNNVVNPYRSVINEAYAKVASEDPYFHCIDMRDAVLEDSWHFNYQWSIYFGQKVYDEMIDTGIISGTKINPQKPI